MRLRSMTLDYSCIRKILVIKLRAIGDVLLSTAVLKNLRAAFPNAKIEFLTENPSREIIEGNPYLDSTIIFDNKNQSGLWLIYNVRQQKYDLVIDLFGNPRSAIVTLFSGARYRLGYRFKWRRYCYNIIVEPRGGEVHNLEFNLDALRALGITSIDSSIDFPLDADAEEFAEKFFQKEMLDERFVVALNPGGGWYTKRWLPSKYAQLADLLIRDYGVHILILWGPGEEVTARHIQSQMMSKAVLIPPSTLKQLGAILKRCSALVTNDSGPMHIAAAMGTPVLAIFGPTHPKLQGPVGNKHLIVRNENLACLGCNLTSCPIAHPCMEELSVPIVFETFKQLVEKNHLVEKAQV